MSYRKRLEAHLKQADGESVLQFKSRLPAEYNTLLREWDALHEKFLETTLKLSALTDRVAATRPDLQYKAGLQKETIAQAEVCMKKLNSAFKSFRLRMRRDQDGNDLGDREY